MKHKYSVPELEIIEFHVGDIVTTSQEVNDVDPNDQWWQG